MIRDSRGGGSGRSGGGDPRGRITQWTGKRGRGRISSLGALAREDDAGETFWNNCIRRWIPQLLDDTRLVEESVGV